MEYFKLNNGVQIPAQGFGTYLNTDDDVCRLSVLTALGAGIRRIDTAAVYENEEAVAAGIRQSGIPREDIFLSTKLWLSYCGYDKVRRGFENSLRRLQTDYVDLFMIHWPFVELEGTWKAMEELYREGKIRAIGVCNCRKGDLERILKTCDIVPVLNQLETHPLNQQKELRAFNSRFGIFTESWATLGRALPEVIGNETILSLAEKYKKTPAQILLRWCFQEGMSCVPKSTSIVRIVENTRIWDFSLEEVDMERIRNLDRGKRLVSKIDPDDPVIVDKVIHEEHDI